MEARFALWRLDFRIGTPHFLPYHPRTFLAPSPIRTPTVHIAGSTDPALCVGWGRAGRRPRGRRGARAAAARAAASRARAARAAVRAARPRAPRRRSRPAPAGRAPWRTAGGWRAGGGRRARPKSRWGTRPRRRHRRRRWPAMDLRSGSLTESLLGLYWGSSTGKQSVQSWATR